MAGEWGNQRKAYRAIITAINKFIAKSDIARWRQDKNVRQGWGVRAALIARFINRGSVVADIGAGECALRGYLPDGCEYIPIDIVSRDATTIVSDINRRGLVDVPDADVIVFSGVLEYIFKLGEILTESNSRFKSAVFTYAPRMTKRFSEKIERRSNGWINDLTEDEFLSLVEKCGWKILNRSEWNGQIVALAESQSAKVSEANAASFKC